MANYIDNTSLSQTLTYIKKYIDDIANTKQNSLNRTIWGAHDTGGDISGNMFVGDNTKVNNYLEYANGAINLQGNIFITGGNAATTDYVNNQVNWKIVTDATDLNTMTTTGKYLMQGTLTNTPTSAWAYLIVESVTGTDGYLRVTQTIWHDTDATNQYTRQLYNTVWGGWVKIANSGDIPTKLSQLTNDIHANIDGVSYGTLKIYPSAQISDSTSDDGAITPKGVNKYVSANYLPLSGGTMTGTALFSFADSGNWSNSNSGVTFPVTRGGFHWSGQSDWVTLFAEETGSDNLNLVLQFGDDNSNGLSIRNTSGVQTAYISALGIFTGTLNGNANTATVASRLGQSGNSGVPMTFNWSGQSGQPSWLWGGNDGTNMYVYNPSNFNVNHANSAGSATKVIASIPANSSDDLVYATIADNDFFRIHAGGASDGGWGEIATADDGNEPIYARQYTGAFANIARTLILLDENGNTNIPGSLYVGGALVLPNNTGLVIKDSAGNAQRTLFMSASDTVYFGCNDSPKYTIFEGSQLQFNYYNSGWHSGMLLDNNGTLNVSKNMYVAGTTEFGDAVTCYGDFSVAGYTTLGGVNITSGLDLSGGPVAGVGLKVGLYDGGSLSSPTLISKSDNVVLLRSAGSYQLPAMGVADDGHMIMIKRIVSGTLAVDVIANGSTAIIYDNGIINTHILINNMMEAMTLIYCRKLTLNGFTGIWVQWKNPRDW